MMQELMKKMAQKSSQGQDQQGSTESEEQKREKEERKQRQLEARKLVESKLLNQSQNNAESSTEQPESNIVCSSSAPPPPPLLISIVTNSNAPPPPPLMINPPNIGNSSKPNQQNGKQNLPQIPVIPSVQPASKSIAKQQLQKELIFDESKQTLANQRKEAQKLLEQKLSGNKAVEKQEEVLQNTNQDVKIIISQSAPPPPPLFNMSIPPNNLNNISIPPPPPPPPAFDPFTLNTKSNNNNNQNQAQQPQEQQQNKKNSVHTKSNNEDIFENELKKEMKSNINAAQKSLEEQISSKNKNQDNPNQEVKNFSSTNIPPPPPIGILPPPPPNSKTDNIPIMNQPSNSNEFETPTPLENTSSSKIQELTGKTNLNDSQIQKEVQSDQNKHIESRKTQISVDSKYIADQLIGRQSSQNESPVRKSRAPTHKPIPQIFNFPINKGTINELFQNVHQINTLAPWSSFKKIQFNTIKNHIRSQKYPEQSVLYFKKCAVLVDQLEGFVQNSYNDENLKKYRKATSSMIEQREQQLLAQEKIQKEQQVVKLNIKLYDKTLKSMNALMTQKSEQNQFEDCIALRDNIKRLQQLKTNIESETNEEERTKKINFLNKELADLLQSGK